MRILLLGWYFLARFDTFVVWIIVVIFDEYAISPEDRTRSMQCHCVFRLYTPTVQSLYSHCIATNTTVVVQSGGGYTPTVHSLYSQPHCALTVQPTTLCTLCTAKHYAPIATPLCNSLQKQNLQSNVQSLYSQCSPKYSHCTANAHHAALYPSSPPFPSNRFRYCAVDAGSGSALDGINRGTSERPSNCEGLSIPAKPRKVGACQHTAQRPAVWHWVTMSDRL